MRLKLLDSQALLSDRTILPHVLPDRVEHDIRNHGTIKTRVFWPSVKKLGFEEKRKARLWAVQTMAVVFEPLVSGTTAKGRLQQN